MIDFSLKAVYRSWRYAYEKVLMGPSCTQYTLPIYNTQNESINCDTQFRPRSNRCINTSPFTNTRYVDTDISLHKPTAVRSAA